MTLEADLCGGVQQWSPPPRPKPNLMDTQGGTHGESAG